MTRREVAAGVIGLVAIFGFALALGVGQELPTIGGSGAKTGVAAAWGSLGLGALVGALIGALATHLLHEYRENRQKKRERVGLVRLTGAEMYLNEHGRAQLEAWPDYLNKGGMSIFRTDAWEASRARLAQLLPEEEFELLATYYMALLVMLDELRGHERRGYPQMDAITKDHIDRAGQAYWDAYHEVIERYSPRSL